jgi:hypothetical protein
MASIEDGRINWGRATKSFEVLLETRGQEFRRLADAATYEGMEEEEESSEYSDG